MKNRTRIGKIQTASSYKRLVLGFSIGVVALLAIILYFSLSRTIITVALEPQTEKATMTVRIDDEETVLTISSIALPGYLASVEMTESKTVILEGEGEAVPAAATGTVTIYNNWSQEQPLQATTRLLTPDGTLFRIKDRVDVPARSKLENVEVYADVEGVSGNIEATTFTIPGLWADLQKQIYAESFEPMTGGLRKVTVLTQAEIAEARTELVASMLPEATALLAEDETVLQKNDTVLPQAVIPVVQLTTTDPLVGSETGTFDLTTKVQFVAALFDEESLHEILHQQLLTDLSVDTQLAAEAEPVLTYEIEDFDLDEGSARISATYTTQTVPRLSSPIFDRSELVNKDRQEINSYFSHFDEVGSATVKFSPFWVTKAPSLSDHIEIRIAQ